MNNFDDDDLEVIATLFSSGKLPGFAAESSDECESERRPRRKTNLAILRPPQSILIACTSPVKACTLRNIPNAGFECRDQCLKFYKDEY